MPVPTTDTGPARTPTPAGRIRTAIHARILAGSAVAWALGAAGPVGAVWNDGPAQRRGGIVLALVGLAWVAVLRTRPSRTWYGPILAFASIGLGELATDGRSGHAPVLVAFAAIAVADAAVVEWAPRPGWPRRSTGSALLAVPFLVAAAIVWSSTERIGPTAALLVVALVVVEAYGRAPRAVAPVDGAVRRVLAASGVGEVGGAVGRRVVTNLRWLRRPKSRADRWFLAAVAVGFGARLAWAIGETRTPVPTGPSAVIGDWYSTWNLRIAEQFAHGHTPSIGGIHTAYWPPGLGAALAPFAWLSDHTGWISLNFAASLFNVACGTATVVMVAALASRWLSSSARNPAAWLMALAPGHIFCTSVAVNETLSTTLLVAAVWGATVIVQSRRDAGTRWRPLIALGILIGFAYLVRDLTAIAAFVPALALRASQGSWKGAVRSMLAVAIGCAVLLVPWAIRNGVQVGWWSPAATVISEGLCASRYGGNLSLTGTTDVDYLDATLGEHCERYSPLDNPALHLQAYVPKHWHIDHPDEAVYARRNYSEAIGWFATHPLKVLGSVPLRVYQTVGNDSNGGLAYASYFNRAPIGSPNTMLALTDASNAWYYVVAGLTLLGLARLRPSRRALPLWVVPLFLAVYPVFGPYAYSRHFFPAYPFLAVLAAGAIASMRTADPSPDSS